MDVEASERDQLLDATRVTSPQIPPAAPGGHRDAPEDGVAESDAAASTSGWIGMLPKLGATAFNFLTSGFAMAAIGALLPDIERHYGTNDAKTALIFPAMTFGYVLATATTHKWYAVFGNRGIAIVASIFRLLASLILTAAPVFGIALPMYGCFGYGTGLTDIAWNAWASGMPRPNILQGLLHGSFSVGCVLGPVVAARVLRYNAWNLFYVVVMILCGFEFILQVLVCRRDTPPGAIEPTRPATEPAKRFNLLKNRTVLMCGFYLFLYVGIEATTTDWIVVYMRRVKRTNATAAGSASSIFWIGMTTGRYALGPVSEKFGVRRSVAIYTFSLLSIQALLATTGFGANAIKSLLAVSGFFAGPLFPSAIIFLVSRLSSQGSDSIPAIALVIAFGQLGGALGPVLMGVLATRIGIQHLFELTCGLSIVLFMSWIIWMRMS